MIGFWDSNTAQHQMLRQESVFLNTFYLNNMFSQEKPGMRHQEQDLSWEQVRRMTKQSDNCNERLWDNEISADCARRGNLEGGKYDSVVLGWLKIGVWIMTVIMVGCRWRTWREHRWRSGVMVSEDLMSIQWPSEGDEFQLFSCRTRRCWAGSSETTAEEQVSVVWWPGAGEVLAWGGSRGSPRENQEGSMMRQQGWVAFQNKQELRLLTLELKSVFGRHCIWKH